MAATSSDGEGSEAPGWKELDSKYPTCELITEYPTCDLIKEVNPNHKKFKDLGTDNEGSLEADQITKLERRITELTGRLEKVEHRLFSSFNRTSRITSTPGDRNAITAMARNEGIVAEILRCFRVIKMYRFATFQSLLLFMIVSALISFGIIQVLQVDESNDSQYKPFKIHGIDAFYQNEQLEYTIPKHYFLMHLQGSLSDIPIFYYDTFNETCEETLDSCLAKWMNVILTEPGNPVITASCEMVAADKVTGLFDTAIIELRNLSTQADDIGTARLDGTGLGLFGVLFKFEFEALATHMNGPLRCTLQIDIKEMKEMLPGFTNDIYFTISRNDLTGAFDYIDSWSGLWQYNDILSKNFVYIYDESTFDTQSKFDAEIWVEKKPELIGPTLKLETNPNPTVVHYVSYNNYSYFDWMADMGGLLSLAVGFFLFMATRITKLAHRGEAFHPHHGILPIFSLPHRNAEELARLRFIVLEALQITEEEYFGNAFQRSLTVAMRTVRRSLGSDSIYSRVK